MAVSSTLIDCCAPPTASIRFTSARWPIASVIPVFTSVRNPACSADTSYFPTASDGASYRPSVVGDDRADRADLHVFHFYGRSGDDGAGRVRDGSVDRSLSLRPGHAGRRREKHQEQGTVCDVPAFDLPNPTAYIQSVHEVLSSNFQIRVGQALCLCVFVSVNTRHDPAAIAKAHRQECLCHQKLGPKRKIPPPDGSGGGILKLPGL